MKINKTNFISHWKKQLFLLWIAVISVVGLFCFRKFVSSFLLFRGCEYFEPAKQDSSDTSKLCQTNWTAGVWSPEPTNQARGGFDADRHKSPGWIPTHGGDDWAHHGLSRPQAVPSQYSADLLVFLQNLLHLQDHHRLLKLHKDPSSWWNKMD